MRLLVRQALQLIVKKNCNMKFHEICKYLVIAYANVLFLENSKSHHIRSDISNRKWVCRVGGAHEVLPGAGGQDT